MVLISQRLPRETLKTIDKIAARRKRLRSDILREAIDEYIAKRGSGV
jgi:metal-responsive CopG/Arc/MetJ family transcriptional regulator